MRITADADKLHTSEKDVVQTSAAQHGAIAAQHLPLPMQLWQHAGLHNMTWKHNLRKAGVPKESLLPEELF